MAAHRSDEDRWARAQHDMRGSSHGRRLRDRKPSPIGWRSAEARSGQTGVASFHRCWRHESCLVMAPLGFNTLREQRDELR